MTSATNYDNHSQDNLSWGNRYVSFKYYVDLEVGCAFVEHTGEFEVGEGHESMVAILRDIGDTSSLNVLRDVRRSIISDHYANPQNLINFRNNASKFTDNLKQSRLAWVVGSARDFGIFHRWTVSTRMTDKVDRKPFRDISEARAWLGIPEDYNIEYPR
jgi:hypothetical protein